MAYRQDLLRGMSMNVAGVQAAGGRWHHVSGQEVYSLVVVGIRATRRDLLPLGVEIWERETLLMSSKASKGCAAQRVLGDSIDRCASVPLSKSVSLHGPSSSS
jgi:hypothetical protein